MREITQLWRKNVAKVNVEKLNLRKRKCVFNHFFCFFFSPISTFLVLRGIADGERGKREEAKIKTTPDATREG